MFGMEVEEEEEGGGIPLTLAPVQQFPARGGGGGGVEGAVWMLMSSSGEL